MVPCSSCLTAFLFARTRKERLMEKRRKIFLVSYELLEKMIGLKEDEFITDVISDSKERCSETILVKVKSNGKWLIPEGTEIPRINLREEALQGDMTNDL